MMRERARNSVNFGALRRITCRGNGWIFYVVGGDEGEQLAPELEGVLVRIGGEVGDARSAVVRASAA